LPSYPSTIALSTCTLTHPSHLIRAHRGGVRSPWRRLNPGQQALLVLAHLRNGDTYARLAGGFGIGIATVCRYVDEVVELLAATAPTLAQVTCRSTAATRPNECARSTAHTPRSAPSANAPWPPPRPGDC
jgi:hypothetical protein